jgi:hypothetical protein
MLVTTYLQGGLGNQMFQIAVAYANMWKLKDATKNPDITVNFHPTIRCNKRPHYWNTFLNHIPHTLTSYPECKVEQNFQQAYEPLALPSPSPEGTKDVCLHGYFQSSKYFEGYDKEIKELFLQNRSQSQ